MKQQEILNNILESQHSSIEYNRIRFEERDWVNLFLHTIKNPLLSLRCTIENASNKMENIDTIDDRLENATNNIKDIVSIANRLEDNFQDYLYIVANLNREHKQECIDLLYELEYSLKKNEIDKSRLILSCPLQDDIFISSNRDILTQILDEIIKNVQTFSPEDSPIEIFIYEEDTNIIIKIRNSILNYNETEQLLQSIKRFGNNEPMETIGNIGEHYGLIKSQAFLNRLYHKPMFDFYIENYLVFVTIIKLPKANEKQIQEYVE
jgi:signal transduction histidine kinase